MKINISVTKYGKSENEWLVKEMNETDFGLKEINEIDYGLKEMREMKDEIWSLNLII